jgi:hypothetical protein
MLFKSDYPGLGANRGYAQPRSQLFDQTILEHADSTTFV